MASRPRVAGGFAVGIEGFGGLADFVGGGGPDELFGLNDVTPDHTIKFHVKVTY